MRFRYFNKTSYISLTDYSRKKVAVPVGKLYTPENFNKLLKDLEAIREANGLVSTVGDRVTYTLVSNDIIPDVAVIDGKERRALVSLVDFSLFNKVIYVENKKGYINLALVELLKEEIENRPILLYVRGEEDLVGFPIVMTLPVGSCMLYGQPKRGIVFVKIDVDVKKLASSLIESY